MARINLSGMGVALITPLEVMNRWIFRPYHGLLNIRYRTEPTIL